MAFEVVAKASSHQVVGLLFLPQTVEGQALHCQRLCSSNMIRGKSEGSSDERTFLSANILLTSMFCKFGVGQDLFAELEPISVLFVLVTSL